jgi:hypothetical protein
VGGAVGLAWLLTVVAWSTWRLHLPCERPGLWGCGGVALILFRVAPVATALVIWLLLWTAGVRPAWPVALLGAGFGWIGFHLYDVVSAGSPPRLSAALAVILACAYAAAAYATSPSGGSVLRIAVVIMVLLCYPLSGQLSEYQAATARRNVIAHAGVPLLGPDLAGYTVRNAWVDTVGPALHYTLFPPWAARRLDPSAENSIAIRVTVAPVSPVFAPPEHCSAISAGGEGPRVPPCPAVGANLWRWEHHESRAYFARRGNVIAVIETQSAQQSENALRRIAETLAPRAPAYFLNDA